MKRAPMLLSVLLPVTLSGCLLSVDRDSRLRTTGDIAKPAFTAALRVGETKRAWIIDRLGQPDAVWQDKEAHEVFRYDEFRQNRTDVSALLLFNVNLKDEELERYYFVFDHEVLIRYWHDNEDEDATQHPAGEKTSNEEAQEQQQTSAPAISHPHRT